MTFNNQTVEASRLEDSLGVPTQAHQNQINHYQQMAYQQETSDMADQFLVPALEAISEYRGTAIDMMLGARQAYRDRFKAEVAANSKKKESEQ